MVAAYGEIYTRYEQAPDRVDDSAPEAIDSQPEAVEIAPSFPSPPPAEAEPVAPEAVPVESIAIGQAAPPQEDTHTVDEFVEAAHEDEPLPVDLDQTVDELALAFEQALDAERIGHVAREITDADQTLDEISPLVVEDAGPELVAPEINEETQTRDVVEDTTDTTDRTPPEAVELGADEEEPAHAETRTELGDA
jgi:hypothetical protein